MRGMRALAERLADSRITLLSFALTIVAALAAGPGGQPATPVMSLPLLLLVMNVIAATFTHKRLRLDLPLLVLHLGLISLVTTVLGSRLTYFDAKLALTTGTEFEGQLLEVKHGPMHSGTIGHLKFANDGFRVLYDAEGRYRATYNRVSWHDPAGNLRQTEIGDDRAFFIDQYRISAVQPRGYAPLFRWEAQGEEPQVGNVQLPDHRNSDYSPWAEWTLARDVQLWVQIHHAPIPRPMGGYQEELGAPSLDHTIILRRGDRRFEIAQGASVELPEGRLTYLGLRSWIGYRVTYDPLANWSMASVLVAIGGLIAFYWRRLRQKDAAE
jgi:cytochrome c biogenesis protein